MLRVTTTSSATTTKRQSRSRVHSTTRARTRNSGVAASTSTPRAITRSAVDPEVSANSSMPDDRCDPDATFNPRPMAISATARPSPTRNSSCTAR